MTGIGIGIGLPFRQHGGSVGAVDTDVSAALAALTLTENPAAVALDVSIAAGVHALTLTEFAASLESIIEVPAGVASLTLTENAAAVAHDINVTTALEALTLTEFQAGVLTGADIPAVIYNGFSDYLKHTGGPAGASDGTTGTLVWCGEFQSDGSAQTLYDIPGTVPVLLQRQSDNTIDLVVGTAGAVASNSTSAVAASLGLLIVLASWSGTTAHLYVIHAAGLIAGTNTPGSSDTVDLTADWYLGADGGAAAFLDAETAFWWADDGFIDFSDSDAREEFWDTTNDLPRDPGSDGSNPSGAQPLICHQSPAASHATNTGSGGDADAGSNSGDATSPGQWAADYSPVTLEFGLIADPAEIGANGGTRTFPSLAFGDAATGRVLYGVFIQCTNQSGQLSTTGVTVDGDAATIHLNIHGGTFSNWVDVVIFSIPQSSLTNPSATSGDVVVTVSGTANGCKLRLFRGVGYSDTPTDTLTVTNTVPNSGTIDFPDNGILLAAAGEYPTTGQYTWTPTPDTEFDDPLRFAGRGSIISLDALTAGAGSTVSAVPDSGGGTNNVLGAVTFPVA